jgi:hypothetical protein
MYDQAARRTLDFGSASVNRNETVQATAVNMLCHMHYGEDHNLCAKDARRMQQECKCSGHISAVESGFSGHIIPYCFLLFLYKRGESWCLALDYVCIRHGLRRTQLLAKIVYGSSSLMHPSTPTLWSLQATFTKVSFYVFLLAAK